MPADRQVRRLPIMAHVRDPTRDKFNLPDFFHSDFCFSRRTLTPTKPIPAKCWLIVRQSCKAEEFKYLYDPALPHATNIFSFQQANRQAMLSCAERQAAVDLCKQADALVRDGLAQYKNEKLEDLAQIEGLTMQSGWVATTTLAQANNESGAGGEKPTFRMSDVFRELASMTPTPQAPTPQTQSLLSSGSATRLSQALQAALTVTPPTVSRQLDIESQHSEVSEK